MYRHIDILQLVPLRSGHPFAKLFTNPLLQIKKHGRSIPFMCGTALGILTIVLCTSMFIYRREGVTIRECRYLSP